jgi:hypothetical protein
MTEHPLYIEISLARQRLWLKHGDSIELEFPVSTSKNGAGECMGSECTPCGEHEIEEKIGAGCPVNTVFVGRQPTGEIYAPELREQFPGRDWILTRILWLTGLEPGKNRGGQVDSKTRYIYLHGTPDDVAMGVPGSRGCVRMRNQDILRLFERVENGTKVKIFPE